VRRTGKNSKINYIEVREKQIILKTNVEVQPWEELEREPESQSCPVKNVRVEQQGKITIL